MTNEIILTPYQATVFNATEALLRTQGYLGEALFEDTYVISKKLAQYIQSSIPQSSGNVSVNAMMAYNSIIGTVTGTVSIEGINPNVPAAAAAVVANTQLDPTFGESTSGAMGSGTTQAPAGRAAAGRASSSPAPFGG